ncbi:hypothetical protein GUJ93_ZPchr0007g4976 [Zizania palustris]|uniref:Alpha/beta hydrolase fold-3 domain-containing protein n=1 Tax=Zizania palustris TaxID=103762 RepID=A0A8J5STA5_ZIZPA|nr:hypothetical protein GUJ93_ZPchr0007g4976 [Zizania palustris]
MEREDQEMAGAKLRRPALPWSVRLRISVVMAATGLAQRHNGTVNRSLVSLVDRQTPARPRPDTHGVRSADVTVDASRGLWARVFSPVSAGSPLAVIVYIHGGGFTMFTAATISYDAMCRRFCRELGAVVVSVNYRLAPEHRFPAAYEDGLDVLRHLSATGLPDFAAPVDLSRCFLVGDSAGGNIAHHVAQRWTSSPPPPNPIRLAGVVLLQPFFGGEKRTVAELRLVLNKWAWPKFI